MTLIISHSITKVRFRMEYNKTININFKRIILITLVVCMVVSLLTACDKRGATYIFDPDEVEYINGKPVITISGDPYESYEDKIGRADYVFVAAVTAEKETIEGKIDLPGMTFTVYDAEVSENIKAVLPESIELFKFGGLEKDDTYTLFEYDCLPEEGEKYIFFAQTYVDGTLLVMGSNSNIPCSDEVLAEVKAAAENPTEFNYPRHLSVYELAERFGLDPSVCGDIATDANRRIVQEIKKSRKEK